MTEKATPSPKALPGFFKGLQHGTAGKIYPKTEQTGGKK
jgi:hypothetical protein